MAEGRTKWPPVEDDWYVEPIAATEYLLARESFAGMMVWDPACGQGNIINTLRANDIDAWGSDLRRRSDDPTVVIADFMKLPECFEPLATAIVTNPPYGHAKLAEQFIRRSLALRSILKVAVFVTSKFLFSDRRAAGLFAEHPPTRIYPVRPRPSCPPGALLASGAVEAKGGVENFVWIVWDCFPRSNAPTRFIWS